MRGNRTGTLGSCGVAAIAVALLAPNISGAQSASTASAPLRAKLRARRASPSDLEVTGDLAGLASGATRYLSRENLLALPQVTYTVTDDPNFNGPTQIKGVLLEELARDLGASRETELVIAICSDHYQATYPPEYLAQHHPVLVLEINGRPPAGWPKDSGGHGFDMGPYMISHVKFIPSFKILSHSDEPQIPWGVVRLEFRAEKSVFGAIAPHGPYAVDADVQAGFKIARQNCFRCHNSGAQGGQKSRVTWAVLAVLAADSPEFFMDYVRNPRAKSAQAQMPGNPQYDDATLLALARYFHASAPAEKP